MWKIYYRGAWIDAGNPVRRLLQVINMRGMMVVCISMEGGGGGKNGQIVGIF